MFFDFDLFWAASDYYSMVVWFSLATSIFSVLIIVILVYLGVIPVQKLKDVRREVRWTDGICRIYDPGWRLHVTTITGFMYGLYELAICRHSSGEEAPKRTGGVG